MKQILLPAVAILAAAIFLKAMPRPEPEDIPEWTLISETTTATVYNAVPEQCNADCFHTASMYRIVPERIKQQRIVAMERTMMAEFGIAYGDSILVEGAGKYDGVWQVQDTMNKKYAGRHRIDFLVPKNIRHGLWTDVKVYIKNPDRYPKSQIYAKS